MKVTLLRAGLSLVLIALILYGAVFLALQSSRFKVLLQDKIAAETGYQIGFDEIQYRPPFKLIATSVTVTNASEPLFTSALVTLSLRPVDLFSKTIHRLALERPALHLDLKNLAQPSSRAPAVPAVRHLNIRDGTIVLKTTNELEFSSINLDAQNLNLGPTGGIRLNADLPWLDSQARLSINRQADELQAKMVVQPRPTSRLLPWAAPSAEDNETLRLEARFTAASYAEPSLTITGRFQELKIGPKPLTGSLDASVVANASFTEAELSGRIEVADFVATVSPTPIQGFNGVTVATFTGKYWAADKVLALSAFNIDSPVGKAEGAGKLNTSADFVAEGVRIQLREVPWQAIKSFLPAPLNQWSYDGTAGAALKLQGPWNSLQLDGIASSDSLEIRTSDFLVGQLAIKAPFGWTQSSFELKDFSLHGRTLSFKTKERLATGAEQVQIQGSLNYQPGRPVNVDAQINIAGGRFASADNTKVGENLGVQGSLGLVSNRVDDSIRLAGKLSFSRGEILWGKLFADIGAQQPVLEFDAAYVQNRDTVALQRATLSLASVGRIDMTGSIHRLAQTPALDLEAQSSNFNAGGFFEAFVRENFKRRYPILDSLVVRGQVAFRVRARGDLDHLTAQGRATLQGGDVRGKSNQWQIGSIALTLPFQISYPDKSPFEFPIAPGILSIRGGRFGSHSIAAVSTSVSLANNRLTFHETIRLSIFGGSVEIDKLSWPDIVKDPKALSFALDTPLLQLRELTDALGWHRFSGRLSGSIPQVRSSGDTLRSEGQIQADLFGGQLQISKMEIENLFSSIPSVKLDARFQDIRLEQASETFAFGKISGILEGAIENLVITNGQPAQFRAEIRTVDRPASSQWISVEALNKITVLSSGQDSSVLYGGLAGFFENFRYSKLGFKATLRNDKLTLKGVESRDGKEFLVVGSLLPPTVNIISHTQEIGFSELLRRLDSIRTEKAETK